MESRKAFGVYPVSYLGRDGIAERGRALNSMGGIPSSLDECVESVWPSRLDMVGKEAG